MPGFLQSPEGQGLFVHAITKLVEERSILPVGNKPNTASGLYLKYRINRERDKKDSELATQIIRNIVLPATVDYYLKNQDDYIKDMPIIETISKFIKQQVKDKITVNERAYELFGDEKFFRGDEKSRSRDEVVLKRLGLSYSDIACVETVEPFFSFSIKNFHERRARNIYIIENKDTFWSFKRMLMDNPSVLELDMLIYGEGKMIISSFQFIDEYDIDLETDNFIYFGDLDAEGVSIYCDLKDKFSQYKIKPFYDGYKGILGIGLERQLSKTPKLQNVSGDKIVRFVSEFDRNWADKIMQLLGGGFYIPQEALSASELKERFGRR